MERRIVERVEDWDARPFSGGHEELRSLSEADFTGAVEAGSVWLFVLNGRIVGVFDGSIDDIEGAEGTAYRAPHPSLPLLYAMQQQGGEPRAKYYTNDTPISEVDETLSSGSFTGYIELSENVLSGDYYQVYYGGRSMSVAFVGSSDTLLTDGEAFERADDEVGIYKVYEVDIEITEIPGGTQGQTSTQDQTNTQGAVDGPSTGDESGAPQRNAATEPPQGERSDPRQQQSDTTGATTPSDRPGTDPPEPGVDPSTPTETRQEPATEQRHGENARSESQRAGQPTAENRQAGDTQRRDRAESQREETERSGERERRQPRRSAETDASAGTEQRADRSTETEPQETRSSGNRRQTEQSTEQQRRSSRSENSPADGTAGRPGNRGTNKPSDQAPTESQDDARSRDADREQHSATRSPTASDPRSDARRGTGQQTTDSRSAPGRNTPDPTDSSSATDQDSPTRSTDQSPDRSPPTPGVDATEQRSPSEDNRDGHRTDSTAERTSTDHPPSDGGDPVEAEEAWRDAQQIPSLDPDRTAVPDETDDKAPAADPTPAPSADGTDSETDDPVAAPPVDESTTPGSEPTQSADDVAASGDSQPTAPSDPAPTTDDTRPATGNTPPPASGAESEPFDAEVLEREDRIDRLKQRVSNLEAENADLEAERDELARTVDRLRDEKHDLQSEIEHLEDKIATLEAELETREAPTPDDESQPATTRSMSATEALSGTDLFVRYASKSEATLEDVHAGDATPEDVNDNLRLEHHTRFESDSVVVDGEDYNEFLSRTLEFRFVEWFVTQLPYEIRDTGHTDGLKDLFDAFPAVDRAELDASVSLQYEKDGEQHREQATFDVVIRDRMGNPLVVANMNDSRDPASEPMMVDLKEAADKIKESSDSLGAAFLVTKSFFAPGALETASEATSGGFLSRDSRESFVKLSRKRGYHLCLVEARGDDFHLNVPEL